MQDHDQDEEVRGDEAGLGARLTRAIKHAIFGGGKDINLPDENPDAGTPADSARVREHEERKMTQNMDRLKDFGRKVSSNPYVQSEIAKAKKRAGKSELDATREALGHKE